MLLFIEAEKYETFLTHHKHQNWQLHHILTREKQSLYWTKSYEGRFCSNEDPRNQEKFVDAQIQWRLCIYVQMRLNKKGIIF